MDVGHIDSQLGLANRTVGSAVSGDTGKSEW
jgi:hypothetical protein